MVRCVDPKVWDQLVERGTPNEIRCALIEMATNFPLPNILPPRAMTTYPQIAEFARLTKERLEGTHLRSTRGMNGRCFRSLRTRGRRFPVPSTAFCVVRSA